MGREHVNQVLPGVGKSEKRKENEQQYVLLLIHISILSSRTLVAIDVCSHFLTMANNKQDFKKVSK